MKLGMTFEGGASRTFFSCGVQDAFLEENLMPDYYIGVSAGIAFGVSYLAKQKGRNAELLETYMNDRRYMGLRYLFDKNKKTYYNIAFAFEEVPEKLLPFDYDAIAAFAGEIYACVTNIHTGKAEYLPLPKSREMHDYLVASCALPIFFRPVKIGKHYYMDGGVADSVPYEQAVAAGCDKNIIILTRTRDYVKKTDSSIGIAGFLYKRYPKFVDALKHRAENYNACMERIRRLEQAGEVFVIAPEDTFGIGRTESHPEKLRKLYDEGYEMTRALMPKLHDYLES